MSNDPVVDETMPNVKSPSPGRVLASAVASPPIVPSVPFPKSPVAGSISTGLTPPAGRQNSTGVVPTTSTSTTAPMGSVPPWVWTRNGPQTSATTVPTAGVMLTVPTCDALGTVGRQSQAMAVATMTATVRALA